FVCSPFVNASSCILCFVIFLNISFSFIFSIFIFLFFFSSRRRHTRSKRDWSSDVCSSDLCLVFLDTSSTRPTSRVPFQPDQRGAKPRANRSIPRHPRMWDSRIFPGLLRDPGDFIFLRRWDSLAPFSLLPCPCRFERFRAIKVIHTSDDTPCTNRKTLPGCKSMPI